jgi:THUMP domain-like
MNSAESSCSPQTTTANDFLWAYLTAEDPPSSPLFASYAILHQMPWDLRKVRKWLREQVLSVLAVKKRRVSAKPEDVLKQRASTGSRTCTLFLMPIASRTMAVLASPMPAREDLCST